MTNLFNNNQTQTEIDDSLDVMFKIRTETPEEVIAKQTDEAWAKIYASRQNQNILKGKIGGIETLDVPIEGKIVTKTVAIVYVDNLVRGIIPFEHSGYEKISDMRDAWGKEIVYKVTRIERNKDAEDQGSFIASRLDAMQHLQGLSWDRLREGMILDANIEKVNTRSLIVSIGGIPVVLPVDEVSHGWIDNLKNHYQPQQPITVKVTKLRKKSGANEYITTPLRPQRSNALVDEAPNSELAQAVEDEIFENVQEEYENQTDIIVKRSITDEEYADLEKEDLSAAMLKEDDYQLEISVKALSPSPWPALLNRFSKGQSYPGMVSGKTDYGVFVTLAPGVDVLCTHPKANVGKVEKDTTVLVRITSIDVNGQKIAGKIREKR